MARTKHGRTAERVATAAEIEQELAKVNEAAKKYAAEGNEAKYDECHHWIDDCLDQLQLSRMMMPPSEKTR